MGVPRRILVVEDDAGIRRGLIDALRFESFHIFEAATAPEARSMAMSVDCDMILLDLRLPGGDGLDILRQVRLARPLLPVIILTARGDETDRVKGLQLGADDYVVKPFSIRELIARVRAVMRRSASRQLDIAKIEFIAENAVVDLCRRELRSGNVDRCELSEAETALLRYLAGNPLRAVSREELLQNVWRVEGSRLDTRAVDMLIARLREKFRDDAAHPRFLITVRGKGYMLCRGANVIAGES